VAAVAAAGRLLSASLLGLFAAGAAFGVRVAPSAFDLAGRYTYSFRNGDITGDHYQSTDELEIAALDRTHALFNIRLHFSNGHECSLDGVARLEGAALVYRDARTPMPGAPPCVLRLWRDGARLRWTDGEHSCNYYCGSRGYFMEGSMAWSSRRPASGAHRTHHPRNNQRARPRP
jgi:hypothetical protein